MAGSYIPGGNAQKIRGFYPAYYAGVVEMNAIWDVMGARMDLLEKGILSAGRNAFANSMDRTAVKQMEDFLLIPYDSAKTLEERRSHIVAYLLGSRHIGEPEIKELTRLYCNADCSVALTGGTVYVTLQFFSSHTIIPQEYHEIGRAHV